MTHSIHMIILNADSSQGAEAFVKNELKEWGSENNYFQICAVLSEDGSKNNLEYPYADWPNHWGFQFLLSPLKETETYFTKAIQHIKSRILGPIFLQSLEPYETYECNEKSAADYLADQIKMFNPATSSPFELMRISNNCIILYNVLRSREQIRKNPNKFEFYGYKFNEPGLTDLTSVSEGEQRYIVFIDMHS